MSKSIILKSHPRIEFKFEENGFHLIDEIIERNEGYYIYNDLKSTDLNSLWFPRMAKWVRYITWVLNAVPMFPEPESIKRANIIIHLKKTQLGIWLTDIEMTQKAKGIKEMLDRKTENS